MEKNLDVFKEALRETILGSISSTESLVNIAIALRNMNLSTFLTSQAVDKVMSDLTSEQATQETLFDLLTQYRYQLLTYGIKDEDIYTMVETTTNVINSSNTIPQEYKAIASIPVENKQDIMLCLLYILRMNVAFLEESIVARQNLANKHQGDKK